MGPQRDGVWRETGIIQGFGSNGPPVLWRVPVKAGYVGPAVAGGKVFLLDREPGAVPERKKGERALPQTPGTERVVCLDAASGRLLWEQAYDCPYQIAYPSGPRATPVVDEGRIFVLGAMGDLQCREAGDGRLVWAHRLPSEYHTEPPVWGYASHPLLDGERLVCAVGGTGSALVAFHRDTGKEIWRALTAQEIGYAPPVLREVAGRRQLIFWHPDAVTGLDPATGAVLWTQPYPVGGRPQRPEVVIAMPRFDGDRMLLTSFYQGSMLVRVPKAGEEPQVVWNRQSSKQSEMTEGLHTVMSTPVIQDGHAYGLCAFGELRCLDLRTGDRKWESLELFGGEGGFFAHAFIVQRGDQYWFWNDHGELAVGRMSTEGLRLTGKAKLLATTENTRGRDVLWCHPAFAHRRAYMHNGREMICVDLAVERS
jgi:outer membrane protein assembly factor BamB